MSTYGEFDPDVHVAKKGQHVAELRSPSAPGSFVPLTAAGAELIRGKIAKGGPVYREWQLTERSA